MTMTAQESAALLPERIVLCMVRRIVQADDLDDAGKVRQIQRVIALMDRINQRREVGVSRYGD